MTFEEMESYLLSIPKFGRKHSIDLVGETLAKIGVRQESFQIIHVAGTNGKGSVCAFLNSILVTAHQKVGMFTSPHLVEMRERFVVNGKMVAKEKVLESFHHVMSHIDESDHPNFFEMMFYIAMYLFQKEEVTFVILETGVGGRLDATNCIQNPLVTILTRIGKDHVKYLGNTYEEIASEKAGIIKYGIPVICLEQCMEVISIIRQKSTEKNAPLSILPIPNKQNYRIQHKKIDFSLESSYYNSIRVMIPFMALYQVENVTLVIRAMEIISSKIEITKEDLIHGIEQTKWAGRMEEIVPNIYADGAHNVDGVCAFIRNVKIMNTRDNILLFAVVEDKNYTGMIKELVESKLFTKVLVVKIQSERGMDPDTIRHIFREYGFQNVEVMKSVESAFRECRSLEKQEKEIYIVGSLYLIGAIKEIIKNTS